MPAEKCNNGKWKWGETGECEYDSQEEAEKDNEDYNETEEMKLDKRHIISITEDDDTYTIVYEKDKDKDDDEEVVEIIDEEVEEIEEDKDTSFYDKERNKPLQKEVKDIWTKTITMEKRYFNIDTRTEKRDDGSTTITGHAAMFNNLSSDLGGFREIIAPNAFSDALKDKNLDCRCLINHDANLILGRSTSGTLRLEETEKGLQYSFDVPDTTYGRDLIISMERGDITQSSFAFTIEDDSWETTEDGEVRTINKVKQLYDVSPVTYPAYPDADDLTLAQRSLAIYREKEENKKQEKDLVKRSLLKLKIELKKRK